MNLHRKILSQFPRPLRDLRHIFRTNNLKECVILKYDLLCTFLHPFLSRLIQQFYIISSTYIPFSFVKPKNQKSVILKLKTPISNFNSFARFYIHFVLNLSPKMRKKNSNKIVYFLVIHASVKRNSKKYKLGEGEVILL